MTNTRLLLAAAALTVALTAACAPRSRPADAAGGVTFDDYNTLNEAASQTLVLGKGGSSGGGGGGGGGSFSSRQGRVRALGSQLIVGGADTAINTVPYQVRVSFTDGNGTANVCGGSVLSKRVVLTACHCSYGKNSSSGIVRAGSSERNSGGQVVAVAVVYTHPFYDHSTYDYDASVLQLAADLALGDAVAVVPLVQAGTEQTPGTLGLVAGWGLTSRGGAVSDTLQSVRLPYVPEDECRQVYGDKITPRMVCYGGLMRQSSCSGDSGGPIVVKGTQVGIVSWQAGETVGSVLQSVCGSRAGIPAVYVDVANMEISTYIESTKLMAEMLAETMF